MSLVSFVEEEGKKIVTNRVGYEERHVQQDMSLVKAMWRLGNVDYEFDNLGIPTATTSSIIALDKTPNKIQKKYKKVVKTHNSYWNFLIDKQRTDYSDYSDISDSLDNLDDLDNLNSTRTIFLKGRTLENKLLDSMKNFLPKIDGKMVIDIVVDKVLGWIQIEETPLSSCIYACLYVIAINNADSISLGIEQNYNNFFKSVIEVKAFDPENTEREAEVLSSLSSALERIGDHPALFTLTRGIAATIRLSWWRHKSITGISDILYTNLGEQFHEMIYGFLSQKISIKIKRNQHRPYFTVKQINSIEEEFGFGHFSAKNYKCNHCGTGRNDAVLYECMGCKRSWYCSQKCQQSDWSQHGLICGRTNNWRTKSYLVGSDCYNHLEKEYGNDMESKLALAYERNKIAVFGFDPATDEYFDCFTDRPVRIKKGRKKNKTVLAPYHY